MPQTRECDFCGGDIEPGTGTMVVHTDGTTVHFCSSKCEKNADLGREPRDSEWTEAGRAQRQRAAGTRGAAEPESGPEVEAEAASEADVADEGEPTDVEPAVEEIESESAVEEAADETASGEGATDEEADGDEEATGESGSGDAAADPADEGDEGDEEE